MPEYAIALFDAFSESPFAGSVAGVVADAHDLDEVQMQRIASEVGAPATGFITGIDARGVDVRFFSTLTEYPMCGHGTLGLMTWLLERRTFEFAGEDTLVLTLRTPAGSATVELVRRADDRVEVMLHLDAATFEPCSVGAADLGPPLGIGAEGFAAGPPCELALSDFTHLVVPIRDLATMRAVTPDFGAIATLSREVGADTVALFTTETEHRSSTLHCREFCPAVGTPEAPAAGTTNRALACYFLRHGLIDSASDGQRTVLAEQGYEMGRPSHIRTELTLRDGRPTGDPGRGGCHQDHGRDLLRGVIPIAARR